MAPHKKGFMALTANPLSSQKNYHRRKKTSQHYDKNLLLLSQMAELQQSLDQCEVLGPEKGRTNQNRTDRNSIGVVRRFKSKTDST